MKRLLKGTIGIVLMLAMIMSLSLTAFADPETSGSEGGDTTTSTEDTGGGESTVTGPEHRTHGEIDVDIKADCKDNLKLLVGNHASAYCNAPDVVSVAVAPVPVLSDTMGVSIVTVTCSNGDTDSVTVNWSAVQPTHYTFVESLPNISAVDPANKTASSLLSYVNSKNAIAGHGSEYDAAIGTAPELKIKNYDWKACDTTYVATGGITYVFTVDYNGTDMVRELSVSTKSYSTPSIYVDYSDGILYGTDTIMQYSLDGTKWQACKANMPITSAWYEKYMYFKYPATIYNAESGVDTVYIPSKAETPDIKLELVSNSHSVTIQNCWDYDNVEFSINGGNWITTRNETYTFTGLSANTSYKVAVRARGIAGECLASSEKSYTIKTLEKVDSTINIVYSESKGIGTIDASGYVESSLSGGILNGSYTTYNLERLRSIVSGYVDTCDDVKTTFEILQYIEDNEWTDVDGFQFSVPMSPLKEAITSGELVINYANDFMKATIGNSTLRYFVNKSSYNNLTINIKDLKSAPSSSSMSWLKAQYNLERPIYNISVKCGSYVDDVKYVIPYTLKKDETIPGVSVYFVDSKGNREDCLANYNFTNGTFEFTSDESGYFVIAKDNASEIMPFQDVPVSFWAYNNIKYCYNHGIFEGVSSTKFDTSSSVNRAMIFTLLARMCDANLTDKLDKTNFSDVEVDAWYANAAQWAYTNKLVSGKQFNPTATMTRADIAVLLSELLEIKGVKNTSDSSRLSSLYTDTTKVSSAAKAALVQMNDLEIMIGKADKIFDPTGAVSRAEMAALLYRVSDYVED